MNANETILQRLQNNVNIGIDRSSYDAFNTEQNTISFCKLYKAKLGKKCKTIKTRRLWLIYVKKTKEKEKNPNMIYSKHNMSL